MNNHNEGSENTQVAMYHDGSGHWMSPKQARYGARVAVLVLGLISVVVFGVGASFLMENKGLNLRIGTDAREGTLPEPDFGKARMLKGKDKDNDGGKPARKPATKLAKSGRKPTPAPISVPTETPISTPTAAPVSVPTATPVSVPTATPVSVPTATPVSVPTATPVSVPTSTPVAISTAAPVSIPTAAPIPLPTAAPIAMPTPSPGCQMQQYTLADVAQNAAASKCWVSLYGVVYDLTSFVGSHPGGSVILSLCGKDGTATFNVFHSVSLLTTKGFSTSIIGRLGSTSGVITVTCNEVTLVSVTTVRRE
jgi:Cytochrome b5-like Heme/Steroid binding domain